MTSCRGLKRYLGMELNRTRDWSDQVGVRRIVMQIKAKLHVPSLWLSPYGIL